MSYYKEFILFIKQEIEETKINERSSTVIFKEVNEIIKLIMAEYKGSMFVTSISHGGTYASAELRCDKEGFYFRDFNDSINKIRDFSQIYGIARKTFCKKFEKYIKIIIKKIEQEKKTSRRDFDNISENKSKITEMMKK